jgi:RNA polymerase sigma-70 factor (ECF subfamily)
MPTLTPFLTYDAAMSEQRRRAKVAGMSDRRSDHSGTSGQGSHESATRQAADAPTTMTAAPLPAPSAAAERERELIAALRRGDEQTFTLLVEQYTPALLRLASLYVSSRAVAEDVVQETWVGVLHGLDRFEGRSALKSWSFRFLVNTAKTRAVREGRTIPFSALAALDADGDEPTVEPERFRPPDAPQWPGGWSSPPASWESLPEERLLSLETRERIQRAIAALPPAQREVITLRDVEGWPSDEVCNLLSISESNQRVLLHRARSRVRRALEEYLAEK